MSDPLSRVLDLVGMLAAGVVVAKEAGVPLPGWLAAAGAIVAFGLGKASRQGVPFRGAAKDETKGAP